jgi:RNA polymerase sigma factor (sigma-70 family)
VNDQTDAQLLHAYVEHRSDPAFAELVHRHVDIVYSAAVRMVCDSHLAQDVTQGVFLALASSAAQLTDRPVLSGWLHRTAQNIAAQTVRTDVRRRVRELEAATMNELLAAEPDALWEHIAPQLDTALGELNEADRDALLLRYFERKSASEMATTLGISDEAAQKRVNRAVERLREFFAKRGLTVGASGLVIVIAANAIRAAPVGLAVTISTAAAFTGSTIAATAIATAPKVIAMTTLQKTVVTATVAIIAGAGIFEARQVLRLRDENQMLQQQQTPLTEQIQQLTQERDTAANALTSMRDEIERLNRGMGELVRLRAEVSSLRKTTNALTRLTAEKVQTTPTSTERRAEAIAILQAQWGDAKTNWLASAEKVRQLVTELNVPDDIATNFHSFTNTASADLTRYLPYFEAVEERDRQARWVDLLIRRIALETLDAETDPPEMPAR